MRLLTELDSQQIFNFHNDGRPFIAVHPKFGIVITAQDEEEFQAKMNEKKPSVIKELVCFCTALIVQKGGDA